MSAKPFAHGTEVSVEKSRAEIDALLGKHGASHRGVMVNEDLDLAQVAFVIRGRQYRLDVPLPKKGGPLTGYGWPKALGEEPPGFWRLSSGQKAEKIRSRWEQGCRERWRAILLMLKAKLELVQLGVSSVEREFLADMVLANGQSMHLAAAEAISKGLANGKAPTLMLPEAAE